MPVVLKALRSQMLLSRKYDLDARLIQLSQKLMDLQTYGSNIADGQIDASDMGGIGSSMFGTQMQFAQMSTQTAYQSAQVKTNAAAQQLAATNPNQQINQQLLFNDIYKKELQEYSNQISQKVNQEEKQLMQEQKRLEVQLKMVEAEYESVQKSLDDDIKSSAIQLA